MTVENEAHVDQTPVENGRLLEELWMRGVDVIQAHDVCAVRKTQFASCTISLLFLNYQRVCPCLEHSYARSSVRRTCSSTRRVSSISSPPTTSACSGGPRISTPPTSSRAPPARYGPASAAATSLPAVLVSLQSGSWKLGALSLHTSIFGARFGGIDIHLTILVFVLLVVF